MKPDLWRPIAERFNLTPALLSDTAARNLALLPMASERMLLPDDAQAAAHLALPGADDGPGIAVIPISGTLIANYAGRNPWMTGYDAIEADLARAVADPGVAGIALLIDSHGGQAVGCFECADAIAAAAAVKPVWALAKHYALSAGYALGSAADRLHGTASAQVGSVGVVLMHLDMSRALDEFGLTVNLIYSGARKVDGNPFEPLPEPVRDRLQAEVDAGRREFAGRVAAARGLELADVLATEAGIYGMEAALANGFADGALAVNEFFASFREFLGGHSVGSAAAAPVSHRSTGAPAMTDQSAGGAAPNQVNQDQQFSQAHLDDARTAGAQAERERIAAILGSDAAQARSEQAVYLATRTQLPAEEAIGVLEASPQAAADGSALERAMEANPMPQVGPGAGDSAQQRPPVKTSHDFMAARRATVQQLRSA